MGTEWRLGRRPGLDGLRGIAIVLVLFSHVFDVTYLNGGPVGVTVFFALSGFLITSLLLEERLRSGSISLARFYGRRTRRLLPALLVVLVPFVALESVLDMKPIGPAVAVLGYVGNWAEVAGLPMGLFSHTWSLAIEEQFYLLFPLLLLLALRRLPVQRLAHWFLALAAVSVALRVTLWYAGAGAVRIYVGTDTRADALLLGCALAAALHAGWSPGGLPTWIAPALVAALAGLGFWRGELVHSVLAPTLTMLAAGPLILGVLQAPAWSTNGVLRWFGARSYGLYLWHVPLVYGLPWFFGDALGVRVAAIALALLIAQLSWHFVEEPFLRRGTGTATQPSGAEIRPFAAL